MARLYGPTQVTTIARENGRLQNPHGYAGC
jgi:hypothetical protein